LASHANGHEDTIRIKISGDGARMTRNSSFVLMGFAFLDLGDDGSQRQPRNRYCQGKRKEVVWRFLLNHTPRLVDRFWDYESPL